MVVLSGEHDVSTLPLLSPVLATVSRDRGLRVVIDLSGATFVDAAVLAALRGAEQAVTGRGGRFGLLPGDAPAVRRILELTRWPRRPCALAPADAGPENLPAARAAG